MSPRITRAETKEAGRAKAIFARPVRVAASTATVVRLQTTVLSVSAKARSGGAILLALEGGASHRMAPAEMLAKAPMLATCAGLASAAASMAIVVLRRITAPLQRAVRQLLVVAQVRCFFMI